jgi:diguanylate cyclase (GGDEF)-like protein
MDCALFPILGTATSLGSEMSREEADHKLGWMEVVQGLGQVRRLPAGTIVWREGDPGDCVLVLLRGQVEIVAGPLDETAIVLRTMGAGSVMGEIACLQGTRRSATVRAVEDCEAVFLPAPIFQELLDRNFHLMKEIFYRLLEYIRELTLDVVQRHGQAITDQLTGLYNFAFFRDRLALELAWARSRGDTIGLAIFDIDHFKHYNDASGHQAGNQVLESMAVLLKDAGQRGDILARYGGEEFIALLHGAGLKDTVAFAEEFRRRVESAQSLFSGSASQPGGRLTISGGAAVFPLDARTGAALIEAADARLYEAKRQGRNCILPMPEADAG